MLRRRLDGAYPITYTQFFSMHPDVQTFVYPLSAEAANSKGFDIVYEVAKPEATILDRVKESAPVYNNALARWEQVWVLEDISSALDRELVDKFIAECKVKACDALEVEYKKAECAGVLRNGKIINTDDAALTEAVAGLMFFKFEEFETLHWPTPTGGWMDVDLKFLTGVFKVIQAHRQRCRATARNYYYQIQNMRHPRDMDVLIKSIEWPR